MRRSAIVLYGLVMTLLPGAASAQSVAARDSALHVLNRLAYGPRPDEVDEVARAGVMRWIDAQLEPGTITDDELDRMVQASALTRLDRSDLARQFVTDRARRFRLQQQGLDPEEIRREMAKEQAAVPGARRVVAELQRLHVLRAVHSERQLYEVMVDFWINHFNVFAGKGLDRFLIVSHVEEVIRPLALGRFEDLLVATAQSPAMLVYLDNVQSVRPGARPPDLDRAMGRAQRTGMLTPEQRQRLESRVPRGLNENYARELLELHTVGVDGGYDQHDVQEVARILTGWSIARPREGAAYQFAAWAHDGGEKTVLGRTFPAGGGEEEGVELLRFLAEHPATRRHVSHKLCQRLVADDAPDGCVDAAAHAWRASDGNIREVVRAIVHGPEFWSPIVRGAKTKTPLEFVVSSVRAVGARPDTTPRLALAVARLGQPLFLQSAPTGYAESAEDWVNSGALLGRMNLAMSLAAGRLPGVTFDADDLFEPSAAPAMLDTIDARIFGGSLSQRTRAVILAEVAGITDPRAARATSLGLSLGGPDFQRQ